MDGCYLRVSVTENTAQMEAIWICGQLARQFNNTLRPTRQNCRHFHKQYFHQIHRMKIAAFLFKFHSNLFSMVRLTTWQRCFGKWIGAKQAPSYCQYQCWAGWLLHIFIIRHWWVLCESSVYIYFIYILKPNKSQYIYDVCAHSLLWTG